MRNVLTLLVVMVANFWMPSAFADGSSLGNFPGYSKPLSGDDTAIRTAVAECRTYVSKHDLKMKDRELEFNGCVGRRGIPLIFLLK